MAQSGERGHELLDQEGGKQKEDCAEVVAEQTGGESVVFRKDDEYGAQIAEIDSGFHERFRIERTFLNRDDGANKDVGLKDPTSTGGEDTLPWFERCVFGKEAKAESRVVIEFAALSAKNAHLRGAFDTDRDLAFFIGDQKDGRAVLERTINESDEAIVGKHGKLDADSAIFSRINLHRLPPSGRVAANDLRSDHIEIGRLLEIECVAQFAVLSLKFFEATFDDAEAADLAFDRGKFRLGFFRIPSLLHEIAGLCFQGRACLERGGDGSEIRDLDLPHHRFAARKRPRRPREEEKKCDEIERFHGGGPGNDPGGSSVLNDLCS